jgi:DNA mismatch repair ATPase MutS
MESIRSIVEMPAFAQALEKKKHSFTETAELDTLFRFRYREEVQKLLQRIYHLDLYISIAGVAKERGFAFADAMPSDKLHVDLKGVHHPGVPKAVGNDIHIDAGGNLIFLTGANMAGKSTFMKSFSIAMFLAHMGFPVPARKMEFSVMDGIYTTINLPDNLGMGASHFYAEVLRVKKMVHELAQGKKLFIVFDELFRGTNVKDAYEATIAIARGFARKTGSLFLISTHIIEAGDALKASCPNVRFIYLPTRMNGHTPVYTYTLKEGITDDRHGMVIINNEEILEILESGLSQMNPA